MSAVNRSERSRIQPFAASWAGHTTSPPITSIGDAPDWNSVRIWLKYVPVSEGIFRYSAWISPWYSSLNRLTTSVRVRESPAPREKTGFVTPPVCPPPPPPPPQPAVPSRAAPASPAPLNLRKSLRLRHPLPPGEDALPSAPLATTATLLSTNLFFGQSQPGRPSRGSPSPSRGRRGVSCSRVSATWSAYPPGPRSPERSGLPGALPPHPRRCRSRTPSHLCSACGRPLPLAAARSTRTSRCPCSL